MKKECMEYSELSVETVCRWDESSMSLLYDHYYGALVAYAGQFVDDDAAEDIVQDIFSTMWERRPDFASVAALKTYLYNSVRNNALNHIRHRDVHRAYMAHVNTHADEFRLADDGSETFNTEEVYRQLFMAIDSLPARQREIFLLGMDGKKNMEIAAMLNISAETVKVQKRRAVMTLRKSLSPEALCLLLALSAM